MTGDARYTALASESIGGFFLKDDSDLYEAAGNWLAEAVESRPNGLPIQAQRSDREVVADAGDPSTVHLRTRNSRTSCRPSEML